MKQKAQLADMEMSALSGRRALSRLGQLSTLPERIAQEIGGRIQTGAIPAGSRIVEAEIASEFGVSHSPVRDALRLLNKMGLVELLPRRGARVAGIDREMLYDLSQVASCLVVVAVRRALALGAADGGALLREGIRADAARLRKLADEKTFDAAAFFRVLALAVEHVLEQTDYNLLPDVVRGVLSQYGVLGMPLLGSRGAAECAARWHSLVNVGKTTSYQAKFGWDFNLFSFAGTAGNTPRRRRYPVTTGSWAAQISNYPEVQAYLNSIDSLIMHDERGHPTLAEQIADKIRESVHSGAITYGDRLTEMDLARRFLTSRGPVREALRILDEQGLIELRPRRGGIVKHLPADEIAEIYDMRGALSELGLGLAATRRLVTRQWEEMFDTGVALMERVARARVADPIVWIELRRALGKLIFAVGGNVVAGQLLLKFEHRLATHYLLAKPTGRQKIIGGWRRIKHAILAGDANEANRILRERVQQARQTVIEESHLGAGRAHEEAPAGEMARRGARLVAAKRSRGNIRRIV